MGKRYYVLVGAMAVVLFLAGFGVRALTDGSSPSAAANQEQKSKQYPLLAKRIFVEDPNNSIVNFQPLRTSLRTYAKDNNLEGSIYFEYLPTGTSVRVDGDDQEVAASLLKLPVAMDLYRAAELGRIDLDKEITLQQAWLDSDFGQLYKKGAGYKLSLREAAKIMLQDSDNTALKAIAASIADSLETGERSINALDVDVTQNKDLTVSISARSYSSFLKCLYFSCYANNEHSQEMLNYLASSTSKDRLVAGVPDKDIKIAHKIGVHNEITQSDCGIVYVPKRNYVLCVMLKGDRQEAAKHITQISELAYKYVTQQQ